MLRIAISAKRDFTSPTGRWHGASRDREGFYFCTERKFCIMSSIKQAAEEMLLQTIIPFWKGLRDEENGGFYGYMDFDLKLDKKCRKGLHPEQPHSVVLLRGGHADRPGRPCRGCPPRLPVLPEKTATTRQTAVCTGAANYTGKPQDTTKAHLQSGLCHLCPFRLLPADQRPRCAGLRKK